MRRTNIVVISLIAIATAFCLYFVPIHGEICQHNAQTNTEDCTSYNIILVLLWHVGEGLNYYGAAITAVATIFIARFTATLKGSTDKLWAEATESSEHQLRAYLYAADFAAFAENFGSAPKNLKIRIEIRNYGQTPARSIRVGSYIDQMPIALLENTIKEVPLSNYRVAADLGPGQSFFHDSPLIGAYVKPSVITHGHFGR